MFQGPGPALLGHGEGVGRVEHGVRAEAPHGDAAYGRVQLADRAEGEAAFLQARSEVRILLIFYGINLIKEFYIIYLKMPVSRILHP